MGQGKGRRKRGERSVDDQGAEGRLAPLRVIDPELLAEALLRGEPGLRLAARRALGRSRWVFAPRHQPCPS